jgi:hypothetical protein
MSFVRAHCCRAEDGCHGRARETSSDTFATSPPHAVVGRRGAARRLRRNPAPSVPPARNGRRRARSPQYAGNPIRFRGHRSKGLRLQRLGPIQLRPSGHPCPAHCQGTVREQRTRTYIGHTRWRRSVLPHRVAASLARGDLSRRRPIRPCTIEIRYRFYRDPRGRLLESPLRARRPICTMSPGSGHRLRRPQEAHRPSGCGRFRIGPCRLAKFGYNPKSAVGAGCEPRTSGPPVLRQRTGRQYREAMRQ